MILKFNNVVLFEQYASKHYCRYSYLTYDQKSNDQMSGCSVHLVFDTLTAFDCFDTIVFSGNGSSVCAISPVKSIKCDNSVFLTKDVITFKTCEHSFVFVATRNNHE